MANRTLGLIQLPMHQDKVSIIAWCLCHIDSNCNRSRTLLQIDKKKQKQKQKHRALIMKTFFQESINHLQPKKLRVPHNETMNLPLHYSKNSLTSSSSSSSAHTRMKFPFPFTFLCTVKSSNLIPFPNRTINQFMNWSERKISCFQLEGTIQIQI